MVPIKARHGCVTLSLKVERCRSRKRKISNLSLQAQHGGLTRYILSVERRVARDKFVLQEEEQITTIRRTGTKKTKSSPELGWRRGAPSCSTSAGPPFDLPPSAGSPRASHPDQTENQKMALISFLTLDSGCERYQYLGCRQGKSLAFRRQLSPCTDVNLRQEQCETISTC